MRMQSLFLFSLFVLVFVFCINDVKGLQRKRISVDQYTEVKGKYQQEIFKDGLPSLYAMENYDECVANHGTFCMIDVLIEPKNPDSKLSQEIKKSKENRLRFDRSKLYRTICLLQNQTSEADVLAKQTIDGELKTFELDTSIKEVRCSPKLSLIKYDLIYAAILLSYAALVLKSSYYDIFERKQKKFTKSRFENVYNIFSIKKNWEKILQNNSNADYQRLKFVQGIRFYAMLMVVVCHTKLSFGSLYVENPIDIEKMLHTFYYSLQLDLLIIQTFFMISTLLLTNQILELFRRNSEFTLYDCWVLYINRVTRLFPTVLLVILLVQLLTKMSPIGPQVWNLFFMVFQECQTNWWLTLFQINFFLPFNKMCMPGSWYLGVDTLLYVTTILILYLTLKFKLNIKKVLAVTFVIMSLKFAHIIYTNNFDVMVITDAELFRDLYHSHEFANLYISHWSSYSTCCVGIAMGYIYFHIKNKDIKLNAIHSLLWFLIFFGSPFLLVYISTRDYESLLTRMIIGPLLKPMYALVMGIGVLGITKNLGGFVRRILEWDFAVKMSNFTYCVYLFHFLLVFSKGVLSHHLVHFKFYHVIIYFFVDVIASFFIGAVCTLTVELPCSELQRLYLPQVRKVSKKEENRTCTVGNGNTNQKRK